MIVNQIVKDKIKLTITKYVKYYKFKTKNKGNKILPQQYKK